MSILKNIYDNFEEYACVLLVGTMIVCLGLQVAMRMFSGSSIAWTEELSRYSFLWAVYIGSALAVKRGGHVRITAQFSPLSIQKRLIFRVLGDAVWIAFNIYIALNGLDVIRDGLAFPETSPTLGIVKSWVEMVIPVGFLLMSLRILEQYYKCWRTNTLNQLVNYEEAV